MTKPVFNSPVTITDRSLLLIKGPDAQKFLQGQVTCDIQQLAISDNKSLSTLGAHCTRKGRMLFSFRACELAEDTIALSVYQPLLESSLEALKKYSVFSKVELIDGHDTYAIVGVSKNDLTAISSLFPTIPSEANQVCHSEAGVIIALDENRFECWINKEQADTLQYPANELSENEVPGNELTGNDIWTAHNISQGIGEVRTQTVEEFIPQMFNYQVIGQGISFEKGCYTGQEVVARMQYLGKLKRRLFRFSIANTTLLEPGAPLYSPSSKQSIGNVVIASIIDQTQELLAVVTNEAVEANQVHIDQECQHKLQALPLPYAINKE